MKSENVKKLVEIAHRCCDGRGFNGVLTEHRLRTASTHIEQFLIPLLEEAAWPTIDEVTFLVDAERFEPDAFLEILDVDHGDIVGPEHPADQDDENRR